MEQEKKGFIARYVKIIVVLAVVAGSSSGIFGNVNNNRRLFNSYIVTVQPAERLPYIRKMLLFRWLNGNKNAAPEHSYHSRRSALLPILWGFS